MIQIRRKSDSHYEEMEIISLLIDLLRAVRDSNEINISHGSINDENIYIGHGDRYRLGDFGVIKIKKIKL